MPTNTCSDSTQEKATASNSNPNLSVCVVETTHLPSPSIPSPSLTSTVSTTSTPSQEPLLISEMSDKIQTSKEPGVCVETGYSRSADPSPRPTHKQYGSNNFRKQQSRNKGSYGSSKGMLFMVCVSTCLYSDVCVCTLWLCVWVVSAFIILVVNYAYYTWDLLMSNGNHTTMERGRLADNGLLPRPHLP